MSTKNNVVIEKIGDRIKSFRIEKQLTLVQLSDLIGISHGSLSGLENNKSKPSAETLSNFCLYTDIDIKWLLTGENREKSEKSRGKPVRAEKIRKFDILNQAEEWLTGEVEMNPKREFWFEVEFEKAFDEFKKWKEEKEESAAEAAYSSTHKVA